MKVQKKQLPGSMLELTIQVGAEQLEKAKKSGMADLRKKATIPGFRKGKAPDQIIEKHFGAEYVAAHIEIEAVNEAYRDAVEQEHIHVLAQPEDLNITSHDPLEFTLKVAVTPEVKLDDKYASFKIEKKAVKVTDEEVQKVIDDTIQRFTTHEETSEKDAKVENGDKVIMSFKGMDASSREVLPGTEGENSPLVIGSGQFIPGFEEELINMKAEEEKEFEITFPKDYHHDDFKNRKVIFGVKVHNIHKAKTPEFTEEFIEQLTGTKQDFDSFKKSISERLEKEAQQQERGRQEEEFLKKAAETYMKDDLPKPMVDHELDVMLLEAKRNLASQGVDFDHELSHMGQTEEQLKEQWRDDAAKRAKQRYLLEKMIDHAKVEVSDEEVDKEIEKVAEMYNSEEHKKEVRRIYAEKPDARASIVDRLKVSMFFDSVLGK